MLGGCISSEGTGSGDHARTPVQILGPIDTTRHALHRPIKRDTALGTIGANEKLAAAARLKKIAPKFKSKQDTLQASIEVRTKPVMQSTLPSHRIGHAGFTIQIGAFMGASNALRAQKETKSRFSEQPVFNEYIAKAKMYRVSVGKFEDRKDAQELLGKMKKHYPNEYAKCWINLLVQ